MTAITFDELAKLVVLRRFFSLAHRLIGVAIALMRPGTREGILLGPADSMNPFCRALHQDPSAKKRCMACDRFLPTAEVDTSVLPPRCECGGILRPDCVFFGEPIDPRHLIRSQQISTRCEVMLVVGTSAEVQPAALMPLIAKRSGATVIEINPRPTALTGSVSDFLIPGPAGEVLDTILEELDRQG